jgi:phosphatidyl-myo-inositol dimannoside synthase
MIIGLFPGLTSIGGVQLAGRQTAAALSLIARDRACPTAFLSLNDSKGEQNANVGETQFGFTGFARDKFRFFFSALLLARKRPKLIFAGHPNLAPIVAMMKMTSPHTRTIVAAHGIEIWKPLSAVRRKALRRADIVTAPSSDTIQKLRANQNVPAGRIRQLPWPLDPDFCELSRRPEVPQPPAGFPKGQTVLSVGRWAANERYKGADLLIQAAREISKEFPELHLVFVGPGDDLPRLMHMVRELGLGSTVHFFTELSRHQLAGCYAAADIFALPSTGEGFGLVFLEAMAFGKPVIGTKMGGIPDVVEDHREGLLIEPTVHALSAALTKLLSNSACRSELGRRAKERVEREFTFGRFQQKLAEIISCEF